MEMGHLAFISRVIPRPVRSNRGNLDIEEVKKTIRFSRAYTPKTSLICVENTHNYWGGAVVDIENLREILFRRSPDLQRIRLFGNKVRSFRYV